MRKKQPKYRARLKVELLRDLDAALERIEGLQDQNEELISKLQRAGAIAAERLTIANHLERRNLTLCETISVLNELSNNEPLTLTSEMLQAMVANGRAWNGLGKG